MPPVGPPLGSGAIVAMVVGRCHAIGTLLTIVLTGD
jgi:hypothetical protein